MNLCNSVTPSGKSTDRRHRTLLHSVDRPAHRRHLRHQPLGVNTCESIGEWIIEFHSVTEEKILTLLKSSPNKQSSPDPLPTWSSKRLVSILQHLCSFGQFQMFHLRRRCWIDSYVNKWIHILEKLADFLQCNPHIYNYSTETALAKVVSDVIVASF